MKSAIGLFNTYLRLIEQGDGPHVIKRMICEPHCLPYPKQMVERIGHFKVMNGDEQTRSIPKPEPIPKTCLLARRTRVRRVPWQPFIMKDRLRELQENHEERSTHMRGHACR